MKLTEYFNNFLKSQVNLDDSRLNRLNGSVGAVTDFLRASPVFVDNFNDTIPQGSYAHKTIINPVHENDEFDADLLLCLEEIDGWEASDYVQELYVQFRASHIYRDKVSRRTRCVTLDYAGDFHMDVVPFLERHGQKYITNRSDNSFELTDPEAYNAWLDEKNRTANRNLVKTIRLVKYLRDYKRTFDVKSVILNALLGQQVNDAFLLADPTLYSDVPTTLKNVMSKLSEYVTPRLILPSIIDPSGTGENFSERWDQAGYASFRTSVMRYAEWIEDAWSEPDKARSLQKWQRIFGDKFEREKIRQPSEVLVKSASALPVPFHNTEQQLTDIGIARAVQPSYRFRIEGHVTRKASMGAYMLKDRGNRVFRNRNIRFQVAECNVPEPFQIYWKVRNRGPEALDNDAIRGQIVRGDRIWRYEEPTSFVGPHYVDCYIVKGGVCVAHDRQEVIII